MLDKRLASETAQSLGSVMGSVLDAVVAISAAGTIMGWNVVAEQIFGWASDEVVGLAMGDL